MVSFQLVTRSEIEEDLTIGSINPSFTKNNKFHYVIASGALGATKQSPENKALLNVLEIASSDYVLLAMTVRKLPVRSIHK